MNPTVERIRDLIQERIPATPAGVNVIIFQYCPDEEAAPLENGEIPLHYVISAVYRDNSKNPVVRLFRRISERGSMLAHDLVAVDELISAWKSPWPTHERAVMRSTDAVNHCGIIQLIFDSTYRATQA